MARFFGFTGTALTAWVALSTCSAMMLFGFDQSVFGGVIVTPDFLAQMDFPNANLIGTITSIYDVGCFFGAVSGTYFGSLLGRRGSVLLGTAVMMAGAILQMAAFGRAQMIVGRIVAGLGNGLNTAAAPVWQSETTKFTLRGKLVVLGLVVNVGGFCFANWLTFALSYVDGPVAWRFPLAFQLIFGLVIFGTAPWLPESPRWLISEDRHSEALEVLAAVQGNDATVTSPSVLAEQQDITRAYQEEMASQVGWWDLLTFRSNGRDPSTSRRFLLGLGAQIIVQLSGINATSCYLPSVLQQSVHLSNKLARLLTAVNGIPYTIASFVGMLLIDKWGRRGAMLIGTAACAVAYLILTVLIREVQYSTGHLKYEYGAVATAMIFLYYIFFGAGWQGTAWLYNTEINSLNMRMKGASASVAAQWAVNYMVVQVTPIGIENLAWKFYMIWLFFLWFSLPIIYAFYPETANRKLEDMDRTFKEGLPIFVFRDKDAVSVCRPARFVELDEDELHDAKARTASLSEAAAKETSAHVEERSCRQML